MTDLNLDQIINRLWNYEMLEEYTILQITNKAIELMSQEPTVLTIPLPCTIVGDIHGQFHDLKELFNTFWNKKVIIILIILISIVLGAIYTIGFTKPVYTSSTTLVLASAINSSDPNTTITATTKSPNMEVIEKDLQYL